MGIIEIRLNNSKKSITLFIVLIFIYWKFTNITLIALH